MARIHTYLRDTGLMARILRSVSWVILGYGASQALRLASNLILVRLLFPEAFGLMALIAMVTIGLSLFSDIGISPSISQSKRGDDPDFLNTAWTMQVIRGGLLCALTAAMAAPMAQFYDEPLLASYLPVAGLALLIAGFFPTRIETAQRHLLVGRVIALDLGAQVIGIVAMVVLAWVTQSVFALVIGMIVQTTAKLLLTHFGLPGIRNRFRWEQAAVRELFGFGKWIFLSTAFFFFTSQGDKAILGKYLSLSHLGIYNIGFFLAQFPIALGLTVTHRLLIPVYRERPPWESAENARKLRRLRHVLSAGVIGLIACAALAGPWIVDLLYDNRYQLAGGIVVLISLGSLISAVGMSYDQVALAAGDSRHFFLFTASRATLQVLGLLIGINLLGLLGALAGLALAALLSYPILVGLARRHKAWDPAHDALWFGVSLGITAVALWVNAEAISEVGAL